MNSIRFASIAVLGAAFFLLLSGLNPSARAAKGEAGQRVEGAPEFKVDPLWRKPLPDRWLTGEVGGTCFDAHDHLFTVNRGNLTDKEKILGTASPAVIEFDPDGHVVNSWGNRGALPNGLHYCTVDYQGNIWIAGNKDAIVQKYSRDGDLLLQIGTKGKFDTSDGTINGAPMNSSHMLLNRPAAVAVDPANGNVYVADGYGNRRVVVFDRNGRYLRQWGRQGTVAEEKAGVGGVFLKVVHCVIIGNDGLVYVCDRLGGRIEVFDKTGRFQRNIPVESKTAALTGMGSAYQIGFSPDPAQKFMYVVDGGDEEVRVMDRATGQALSTVGRPGLEAGEFDGLHSFAIDSKGDIVTGEAGIPSGGGHRVQMFRLVGN